MGHATHLDNSGLRLYLLPKWFRTKLRQRDGAFCYATILTTMQHYPPRQRPSKLHTHIANQILGIQSRHSSLSLQSWAFTTCRYLSASISASISANNNRYKKKDPVHDSLSHHTP